MMQDKLSGCLSLLFNPINATIPMFYVRVMKGCFCSIFENKMTLLQPKF